MLVQDYAELAAPLTNLQKKGVNFRWSEQCQVAFDRLKEVLTTAPILAMQRNEPGVMFILDTDASDHAIGAVLSMQLEDGTEQVVSYVSKVLQPH